MTNTDDMRYVRTEKAIRTAFMGLVGKEPVGSITVSEICRAAGISRNAFYLHHANVLGLYGTLVNELVEDVRRESFASAERVAATGVIDALLALSIVHALSKHEDLLRALLPSDDGSLAKCLAEGLEAAYVEAGHVLGGRAGGFEHRMSCAFAAWAHVGMLVRWVAETDRPLGESQELFTELQEGLSMTGTRLLVS